MKIKSIELTNFCQHEDLKLGLPGAGVTVVTGKNGVGKSNLIRAIEFALTGKFLETSRNKQEFITYGKDNGGVSMVFDHNGYNYEVTRTLHSNGCTLNGPDCTLSGITQVNAFIENLLGTNSSIINEFVVVKQGRLNSLLESTNSNRLGLFMKLFDLDRIDTLYRKIGAEISIYSSFTAPPIPSAELEASLDAFKKQREVILVQIEELDYDIDAHNKLDNQIREHKHTLSKIEKIQEQIDNYVELCDQHKNLLTELTQLADKRNEVQKEFDEFSKICPESLFVDIQTYKTMDFENKLSSLSELKTTLDQLNLTVIDEPGDIEAINDELLQVSSKISTLSENLELFNGYVEKFKAGECPTCGTTKVINQTQTGKSIQEYAVEAEQEVERLQEKLKTLEEREHELVVQRKKLKEEHLKYKTEKDKLNKLKTETESQINSLTTELLRFSHLFDFDLEEAENKADKYRLLEVELVKVVNNIDQLNKKLQSCETMLEFLRNSIESESDQDKGKIEKELEEYEALFEVYNKQKTAHDILIIENRAIDDKIINLEKSIEATIEMEKNCAKQKQYLALLNDAKTIFHRSAYPTVAASQYLQSLNIYWNDILSNLSVPFSVNVLDDLSIHLQGIDNNINTDAASGGQKACLSIAFLLAVNKLFTSNIGFMLLDEPTYGLDEDHITKLVDLLLYDINKFASNTDIQIFVVTHEDKFKDAFDTKIVLQ